MAVVSAWVMRGFLTEVLAGHDPSVLEFYGQSIDLLEWGRGVWKDVPTEDRGVIFEKTFIRGIRRMYLSALLRVRPSFSHWNRICLVADS